MSKINLAVTKTQTLHDNLNRLGSINTFSLPQNYWKMKMWIYVLKLTFGV